MTPVPLSRITVEPLVRAALLEDLGGAGDLTTDAIVPAGLAARAALVARETGVVAGLDLAKLAFAGGIAQALRRARAVAGHLVKIEAEVDNLDQLEEALGEGADAVLLDNMSVETLAKAVRIVAGRAMTEASGRITPETAPALAATGVDLISVGWLTHSAPALDIGLDFEDQGAMQAVLPLWGAA